MLDAISGYVRRSLLREIDALLGEDAVARLVPDAPFSPAGDAPQLALTAVDPATTLRDLSDAFAMHLGLVRAHAAEVPGVAEALDADAMSAALKGSLTRIASAAARALAFDPAAGLKLAGAIVATVRRAERANQAYASAAPAPGRAKTPWRACARSSTRSRWPLLACPSTTRRSRPGSAWRTTSAPSRPA